MKNITINDSYVGNHPLADYLTALENSGPLAYLWKDKPHRMLLALARHISTMPEFRRDMVHTLRTVQTSGVYADRKHDLEMRKALDEIADVIETHIEGEISCPHCGNKDPQFREKNGKDAYLCTKPCRVGESVFGHAADEKYKGQIVCGMRWLREN